MATADLPPTDGPGLAPQELTPDVHGRLPADQEATLEADPRRGRAATAAAWQRRLAPLASLKLTVALLAGSIFIVLAGTMAQVGSDIWTVVSDYFRFEFGRLVNSTFPYVHPGELFVWVDADIFLPPAFAPQFQGFPDWVGFPFPKGWTLGIGLLANLLAAHLVRFKLQASGPRLAAGLLVTAFGVAFTTGVVMSGGSAGGFQEDFLLDFGTLWTLMLCGLAVLACACGYWAVTLAPTRVGRPRTAERLTLAIGGAASLGLFFVLLGKGEDGRLGDEYMRILWQLIKGTMAGAVLLVGCVILFRKRAGIVLLHAGVGLMMVGEIVVGLQATEAQMPIEEGRANDYAEDSRAWELAVVEMEPEGRAGEFAETVVSEDAAQVGETVALPGREFSLRVQEFFENSFVNEPSWDETPVATAGQDKNVVVVPEEPTNGLESRIDSPSAVVELVGPAGEVIETLVLSTWLDPQRVDVGGRSLLFDLRFARDYKPYVVALKDMQKVDYVGTRTVQNYSAYVAIADPDRGERRDDVRIWMNNPLRYGGETLYQSGYTPAAVYAPNQKELTRLQIVSNRGWMIPYVACMIVAVGMVFQFGLGLLRFIDRRRGGRDAPQSFVATEGVADGPEATPYEARSPRQVPAAVLTALAAAWLAWCAMPASTDAAQGEADAAAFGRLPVAKGGRVKPLDSLARNTLLVLSDKQKAYRPHPDAEKAAKGKTKSAPAVAWLLDSLSGAERADEYLAFRVESGEVRDLLGLPARKGLRYSYVELSEGLPKLEEYVQAAAKLKPDGRSLTQRKAAELLGHVRILQGVQVSFVPLGIDARSPEEVGADIERKQRMLDAREGWSPPLTVPVDGELIKESNDPNWMTLAEASLLAQIEEAVAVTQDQEPAAVVADARALDTVLQSWRAHSDAVDAAEEAASAETPDAEAVAALEADLPKLAEAFDASVAAWSARLQQVGSEGYDRDDLAFEAFFNGFAPFNRAWILYIAAGVLTLVSLLAWGPALRTAAFWLSLLALAVHTFALWARIEISGRPPVTNLYSSAVFIGWAAVVFGLALEAISKHAVGLLISSLAGGATLQIAHVLATDGDTFTVMQAVLDTQFWLATHVVTVTLGYSATFVAGLLGVIFLIRHGLAYLRGEADFAGGEGVALAKQAYGVTCFAVLFSFVGTVLGGLWADDSWGRFWGWDPKENGALMIVLANAIVLHARWGKLVRDRGLCVLAVLSNCVVAWSWFGVNELGVGLHSYGFTEGVLLTLAAFGVSQLAVACLGLVPPVKPPASLRGA